MNLNNFIIYSLISAIFLFHCGFTDQTCQEGSPNNPEFKENRVIIAGPTIIKLEKSSFICETCEFIATLNLTGRKIKEIEDGAFENLKCLKNLDMSSNEVLEIHPKTFAELKRLKMLNFKTNNLKDLKNMTFAKNYQLNKLDLASNNIKHIENFAFYNLTSLEWLLLSNNEIMFINFEMFRNLPKLKVLHLAFNNLARINPPKTPFPNIIELIDVSNNQLSEAVEQIYLPNVKELILSHNNLKKLDLKALKNNCPKLHYMDLAYNIWNKGEILKMEEALPDVIVKYGEITSDTSLLSSVAIVVGLLFILLICAGLYKIIHDYKNRRVHSQNAPIELHPLNQ